MNLNQTKNFLKRTWNLLKRKKWWVMGGLLVLIILSLVIYFVSFDKDILNEVSYSTTFYDRNNKPLRTYFSSEETYSRPCKLSEVSPHFLRAIVLIEDKNFYSHRGIVLSSLMRAVWQNVKGRRVVSGGSTITMQLTKSVYRHRSRSFLNKISEVFSALKFEMHLGKSEILEAYINRLPFGNLIYGVNEASRFYFDKAPSQLSLNQAIYLALIPKSPSLYNPNRHLGVLKKRWKTILEQFRANNNISRDEYLRAQSEGIQFQMNVSPFAAPHFIEMVKARISDKALPEKVYTTLDLNIQNEVEGIIRGHLVRLSAYRVRSASAVVIDNRTHSITALVGGPNYFDHSNAGNVNLATALRQPGSTLKPFVYGLALETGYTPASILPDIKFPAKGGFFPQNHDGKEHGPLRLRNALACSYNIPAFYMAMKLKPQHVIDKLQKAGFSYLRGDSGFYGETIALGSGEVKLVDLTAAYSAFANRGILYSPIYCKGEAPTSTKLFDETAAFLIWDILSDPSARFASFGYDSSMNLPFPVAVKTGTSKGFRDKWAIGVNSEFTVGVWMGNPDGENMRDTSNVGNVPTIMRDIFFAIQKDWTRGGIEFPSGVEKVRICELSGEIASPDCPDTIDEYFDARNRPGTQCSWHIRKEGRVVVNYPELYKPWVIKNNPGNAMFEREKVRRISNPQQGDCFYISDAISRDDQQIRFEILGCSPGETVEYYVDNQLFKREQFPKRPFWKLQRGEHTLTVRIAGQTIDSIHFSVR